MATAPAKLSVNLPLPTTILRVSAVTFLVAVFACALLSRGVPGGVSRELAGFFLLPMFLFWLFFVQYKIVATIAKSKLNVRLGHLQAFGCLAIVLYGIFQIFSSRTMGTPPPGALPEYTSLILAIFGEVIFVGNIIWSFVESNGPQSRGLAEFQPVLQPFRQQPDTGKTAAYAGWPRSPVRLFGFSALFFVGMGLLFKLARPFSVQMPIPWRGHLSQVPFGYLWMFAAVPFAAFALIYWGIELFTGWKFELSTTRIHLVCTILVVVETTRVYSSWAMSLPFQRGLEDAVTAKTFSGVFAFGILAVGAFAWNLWASRRSFAKPS